MCLTTGRTPPSSNPSHAARPRRATRSGSAPAKKSRSKPVRCSPEQPRMTARGDLSRNDAPDIALPQFAANALGIGNGPRQDTVEYALVAEIGAHRGRRKAAQQVGVGPL